MTAKIESSNTANESVKLYFFLPFFLKNAVISILWFKHPSPAVDPAKVAVFNDFPKVYIVQAPSIEGYPFISFSNDSFRM
jgi:hypothetical protein